MVRRILAGLVEAGRDFFDVCDGSCRCRAQGVAGAFELGGDLHKAAVDVVDLHLHARTDALQLFAQVLARARHLALGALGDQR